MTSKTSLGLLMTILVAGAITPALMQDAYAATLNLSGTGDIDEVNIFAFDNRIDVYFSTPANNIVSVDLVAIDAASGASFCTGSNTISTTDIDFSGTSGGAAITMPTSSPLFVEGNALRICVQINDGSDTRKSQITSFVYSAPPSGLTADTITDTTIGVSWTNGGSNLMGEGLVIENPVSFVDYTNDATTHTFTSLTKNTNYLIDLYGVLNHGTSYNDSIVWTWTDSLLSVTTTNGAVPVITLLGNNPTVVDIDSTYVDAGATASDLEDGDITGDIVVNSNVNTSIVGDYTVTYDVTDSDLNDADQVTRTVEVRVFDADGDGYDSPVYGGSDCNDEDDSINPGVTEILDGIDNNCNAEIDEGFTDPDNDFIDSSVDNCPFVSNFDQTDTDSDGIGDVCDATPNGDSSIPVITILGDNPATVELNIDTYSDAGATASDLEDGDITSSIITTGADVDESVLGPQFVTYDVTDSNSNNAVQQVRLVNVVDTTAPEISLNTGVDEVLQFTSHTDAGVTCTDNDGYELNTINNVDVDVAGEQTIEYTCTDPSDNSANIIRTVTVIADSDADGIPDSEDVCPFNADNICDATDDDGDGVINELDICPGGDDSIDTDFDGIPDFCDLTPNGDDDGDGVDNLSDICPGGDDTVDTDTDGTPDFCDATPNGDSSIPVIYETGDVTLTFGETFTETAYCTDLEDGSTLDEESILTLLSTEIPTEVGVYELEYSCTDSDDNTTYASRTLTIVGPEQENDGGGSGDREWMTKPTFGRNWENTLQLVDDGVLFNRYSIQVTDNWHTDFIKQIVVVGSPNVAGMKVYSDYDIKWVEFAFDIPGVGYEHQAGARIVVPIDWQTDKIIDEDVYVKQSTKLIDVSSVRAFQGEAECSKLLKDRMCDTFLVQFKFLERPEFDVFAVKAVDEKNRVTTTYLNEGIEVNGESLNPPEIILVASPDRFHRGLVELTQIGDKFENTWQSEDGYIYQMNQFGTFVIVDMPELEKRVDNGEPKTRNHSAFNDLKSYEEQRAKYAHWNADDYISTVGPSFAYEFPDEDSRTKFLKEHGLYEWARGQ